MQLTYPGVYVQEIPSSVRPISTVSTSVGAFVDRFPIGETDKAVQLFGMADFERVFGGVTKDSESSYQIAQFFLNGGSSAWVVRIAPGADTASVDIAGSFTAKAASPGAWGNTLRLTVEPVVVGGVLSNDTFNLVVSRYAATQPKAPLAVERFVGLSINPASPRFFKTIVDASSQLVRLDPVTSPAMPTTNGSLGDPLDATLELGATYNGKQFTAKYGTTPQVTVHLTVPPSVASSTDLQILRGLVESQLRAKAAAVPAPGSPLVSATVTLVGNRLWFGLDPRNKDYDANLKIDVSGADFKLNGVAHHELEYKLGAGTAGTDGGTPSPSDILGDPNLHTGMHALDRADLFNILCLPQASDLGETELTAVVSGALDYCQQKRAMLLIDPPSAEKTPAQIENWVGQHVSLIASPNTALYYPRINVPDPANNFQLKPIGASGTVAGVYARTDTERGVWKAPAGIDAIVRGVASLDYQLSDGENGALNQQGISCLRNFPVYGQVVWGARTLFGADARASEWKYVPIRRLALMIEESLFRGTKWVVFEPNDEPLWAKIRQNVGAFMTGLFRQGAFQGSTPDKAFFVKCDGETTTAHDRNLGVVNIEVGFAPLKPAEFVVLKIQQIPDLT